MSTLWPLIGLRLRRDRVQLPVWVVSLAALALFSAVAVADNFGPLAEREALVRVAVATPTILMFRGVPQGTDVDALVFFEVFVYLAVMVAFMNTFLAVRHSRAEEESGRQELLAATPAGRSIPLLATALHGLGANLAVGVAVALAFLAAGFEAAGAFLCGAGLVATGIAFLGVGLLAAQLMRTSRGANGLASALIGVAFALRAAGDAGGTPSADGLRTTSIWLSWLSPIGWAQQTAAFTANQPAPLLLDLALGGLLVGAVVLLQSRRDLGSSIVPERSGPANARRTLHGAFGLAWRLQWPATLGWAIAGLVFGLLGGTLGETVAAVVEGNPQFGSALAGFGAVGHGAIIDLFTSAIFSLVGLLAATAATQAMIRIRQEEAGGGAELLLSTPLDRARWIFDYLCVGGVAIVLVVAAAVAGAAIGLTRSADTGDRVASALLSGLAQLPAALLILAIAALLFALVPRLGIGLSWGVLLAALFVGQFGGLLGLPDWLRDLSPFTHTPVVAGLEADWSGAWWMLGLAAAVGGVAVVRVRRRDLAL